ncbi:MAG: hypothetical protein A2784_02930 [Candidatus Chisholmbacteria bacterium RIFCSPHIGHO2_01_FULL_48_12]|uniref:Glycosyl transferase family 1 domain-containing protein n=1 Tax=Candidatus Chisholmbacteria bacterium RIFCSPHIGHO2_01_FULL_48_12 TaxID=1797589 RepID=A0A1G1VUS4_9BACT|nr:MAG: hypothetical protein A2784_02930 [Candidatus Chisholmbacteria bacterium RIFCSPHIGHO2_01_FULL_48_12]
MLIGIDGNEANIKERVGSNVYAFELITEITKRDQHNEYIIYLRENRVHDLPKFRAGLNYRILPPKILWTQWRLPLDLYWHQPRPQIFFTPGHYAPRFSSVPTVISILDLAFLKFPQFFKPAVLSQLKNWTKYSIQKASHIFAISEHTKQDIINYYGVDATRITVTYPGIHPRFRQTYSPDQIKVVLTKYHLPTSYLLFVGTRQPRKNLDKLIQAVEQIPNAKLIIVGKTWYQFKKSEIRNPKSEKIITLDYISDEDLPLLMLGSQALVLPSLYEGFGIPVVEAMAVGTPVVVSNVSSLPEVVGDSGVLIDPESVDSIAKGLRSVISLSNQKRVQLIKLAQQRSRQFTWANCARKALEVLNAVTA